MESLDGRGALVTGAGSGLGREIARSLAVAGCNVAVHYSTNEAGARDTVRLIEQAGGSALVVGGDLHDAEVAGEIAWQVAEHLGAIDVLVNNAATTHFVPFSDLESASDAVWNEILDLNVLAPFRLVRAVAPAMRARGWGRILNVASVSGLVPDGSSIPYVVAKAGLVQMTRALARGLSPTVLVNAVAPGWMATEWVARHAPEAGADDRMEPDADVVDVAETSVSIVRNPSMNGAIVVLDGGRYLI